MYTVSLMQPYFFPYLGYFDLLSSSDVFVFYDDAAFSKNGWYNRNRIYNPSREWEYIRLAVRKSPLQTPCNLVILADKEKDRAKLLQQLAQYKKAPFYQPVMDLVEKTFADSEDDLASVAIASVELCAKYIGLDCTVKKSSEMTYDQNGNALTKVLDICKITQAERYLNVPGGRALYSSGDFEKEGLALAFTSSDAIEYETARRDFVPYLSILDALMWVSPDVLKQKLSQRGTLNA